MGSITIERFLTILAIGCTTLRVEPLPCCRGILLIVSKHTQSDFITLLIYFSDHLFSFQPLKIRLAASRQGLLEVGPEHAP